MTAISSLTALFCYMVVLCGIVPLFPWLTMVPRLLLVAGMAAAVWQSLRGEWRLPNWLLNISTVPFFFYYAAQFSRSNAVQPVVSLLAIMLGVRLAGEKNVRHYLQILALSLFCLAASSLFDLSPLFLLYLALLLILVALSLVLLTFYDQDSSMHLARRDLRRVLAVGALMPLASVPLLLFFFPLLPRTQLPLWNISGAPASRSSGLSDRVEPGSSERAGESFQLAFRAEMSRLAPQQLYWRAAVFNRLEGNRWIRDPRVPAEHPLFPSRRVSQVIYPEPGLSRFLLALDAPAAVTLPRVYSYPDATLELRSSGSRRVSYRADSCVGGTLPVRGGIDRGFYLQLPASVPDSLRRLAERIRREGEGEEQRVELLERYFRDGGYSYSMQGLPTGAHALERFLFETRRGHCEFFASSFALLARLAGVPSRLVGGYLGGEYNDVGGYYLITESMAHVWVEVFIPGRGWRRIDPSSFARNAGAFWGGGRSRSLMLRLRMALDSLNHAWNRSVISYDFQRQADVARGAARRLQRLTPGLLLKALALLLVAGLLVALAVALFTRRGSLLASREELLLRGFYRLLRKESGVDVRPGRQGLLELAGIVDDPRVDQFVSIYAGALYHDRKLTDEEYRLLRHLLRAGFSRRS